MGNRSSYPPGTRDLKRGASTLVDRARAGDLHTTRMDLQLSAAHLRFRNELRAWLATNLPRPWREDLLLQAREDARAALRVDGEPARAGARRGGVLGTRAMRTRR